MHGGGEADCSAALSLARRVLQEDPTSVTALVVAGMALVCMERVDAAEKYLAQAHGAESERADLRMALGALETLRGDHGTAVRHLETACRLASESWETHLFLGRALMALARARHTVGWSSERPITWSVRCASIRPPISTRRFCETWACVA